jgi:putative peptidoglycan lipid II flippase
MNPKKAMKAVFIIIFFALGSKALGFIREALIASKFGAGIETDTFFIAITATTLFTSLITQAIATTTIPVLSEIEKKEGKAGKLLHINNLFHVFLLVSFIIFAIGWLVSPAIIRVLALGFKGEQFELAVRLTRIGLPVIFFSTIVGLFRGYLQSELMFNESAISQLPFNFTYIAFLLFLSSTFGIAGLMVTSVIAVLAQISFQLPGLKKIGYKYKFIFYINDTYLIKIVKLIPSVLASVGISDINKIVDRSLASTLAKGSISSLSYAYRIEVFITQIFVSTIGTVIFPILSDKASRKDYVTFKKIIRYSVNIVLLVIIPVTVFTMILSGPIVKIAFQRGAFDAHAALMTRNALIFYSLGLAGLSMKVVLLRVYYALQDTHTPMINSLIAMFMNIVLSIMLMRVMTYKGLALATSISAIFTSGLLLNGLRRKIGSLGIKKYIECGLKSILASIVMAGGSFFCYYFIISRMAESSLSLIFALSSSLTFGAATYLLIIYSLNIEEMNWIVNMIKTRINKPKGRLSL